MSPEPSRPKPALNRRPRPSALAGLIVLLAVTACAWAGTPLPNIVLILTDDLGINDLGCYGRADQRTPHLDRLAAEGMRFTAAYCAQPICSPSRAALLTGRHPARLHLTTYLPGRPDCTAQQVLHPRIRQELPLEEVTLAEALQSAGYISGCFGKWHLGGQGFGPREQGFAVYFAGQANTAPSDTEGGKGEYELTAQAMEFMAAHRDRPFFVYLAHNSPHIPLAAKSALIERNRDAFSPLYAAVIETLDDTVGRLLARIDTLGLRDNTLVIFTSDNGGLHVPELREDAPTYNRPFRAGKGFLYEGGLRVPLMVRWPGHVAPGTTSAIPVVNTDWMPTLLEILGRSPSADLDGRSFAAVLDGRPPAARPPIFWHFPHYDNQGGRPGGAVRRGDWKLIEFYDTQQRELYNLGNDPGEARDLARQEPKRVAELRDELAAWRVRMGAQTNTINPAFDADVFRRLYVDTDVSKIRAPARSADLTPVLRSWRAAMDAAPRQAGTASSTGEGNRR